MGELREEVSVKVFQEETGGELVKVGCTRGKNGMRMVDKKSGCAQSGSRGGGG